MTGSILKPAQRESCTTYEEYDSADAARSFLDSTLIANHVSLGDGIHAASGAEICMAMILKENHLDASRRTR